MSLADEVLANHIKGRCRLSDLHVSVALCSRPAGDTASDRRAGGDSGTERGTVGVVRELWGYGVAASSALALHRLRVESHSAAG